MKYSVVIINSNNIRDFFELSTEGIRYNNLDKFDVDKLIELSLEQNFSVIIQKDKEEG